MPEKWRTMKTALIIYWSKTGNTEKAATSIKQGLEETGVQVTMKKPEESENIDYFDYDLVCIGSPSYSWHPPEPMTNFLKKKFAAYRLQGKIKPSAPKVPGKKALIFVTYSGPHTGIDEAYSSWQGYAAVFRAYRLHRHRRMVHPERVPRLIRKQHERQNGRYPRKTHRRRIAQD